MDRRAYETHHDLDARHFWRVGKRRLILDWIDRYWSAPSQPTILDVGGCASVIAEDLSARGDLTVVEPDRQTLDEVRDRVGDRFAMLEGSLPDELPEGPFDLITLFDVLEHVDDDRAALASLYARLRPGGAFVLTVPAFQWLWSDHDVVLEHRRRYRRPEIASLLAETGFEVRRLSYYTTLLFPAVVASRLKPRRPHRPPEYRVSVPPGPVNAAMTGVMALERQLLSLVDMPIGSSLIAVAYRR